MNPTENNPTIGLDLGDRQHAVCVLNATGDIVAEESIPNTREVLTAFAARYPAATFVMETGTHSPWVSRLLESLGHRVLVANASKLRAIFRVRPNPTARTPGYSRASRSASPRAHHRGILVDIQAHVFIRLHVLVSFFVVRVVVHPSATTLRLCAPPRIPRSGDKHTSFNSAASRTQL